MLCFVFLHWGLISFLESLLGNSKYRLKHCDCMRLHSTYVQNSGSWTVTICWFIFLVFFSWFLFRSPSKNYSYAIQFTTGSAGFNMVRKNSLVCIKCKFFLKLVGPHQSLIPLFIGGIYRYLYYFKTCNDYLFYFFPFWFWKMRKQRD